VALLVVLEFLLVVRDFLLVTLEFFWLGLGLGGAVFRLVVLELLLVDFLILIPKEDNLQLEIPLGLVQLKGTIFQVFKCYYKRL